jgi:hypothetical protein
MHRLLVPLYDCEASPLVADGASSGTSRVASLLRVHLVSRRRNEISRKVRAGELERCNETESAAEEGDPPSRRCQCLIGEHALCSRACLAAFTSDGGFSLRSQLATVKVGGPLSIVKNNKLHSMVHWIVAVRTFIANCWTLAGGRFVQSAAGSTCS